MKGEESAISSGEFSAGKSTSPDSSWGLLRRFSAFSAILFSRWGVKELELLPEREFVPEGGGGDTWTIAVCIIVSLKEYC